MWHNNNHQAAAAAAATGRSARIQHHVIIIGICGILMCTYVLLVFLFYLQIGRFARKFLIFVYDLRTYGKVNSWVFGIAGSLSHPCGYTKVPYHFESTWRTRGILLCSVVVLINSTFSRFFSRPGGYIYQPSKQKRVLKPKNITQTIRTPTNETGSYAAGRSVWLAGWSLSYCPNL